MCVYFNSHASGFVFRYKSHVYSGVYVYCRYYITVRLLAVVRLDTHMDIDLKLQCFCFVLSILRQ